MDNNDYKVLQNYFSHLNISSSSETPIAHASVLEIVPLSISIMQINMHSPKHYARTFSFCFRNI